MNITYRALPTNRLHVQYALQLRTAAKLIPSVGSHLGVFTATLAQVI